MVEIDFAFQNGRLRTVRSEGIQWKTGRNVDMFFVSAVLKSIKGRFYLENDDRTEHFC